MTTKVYLPDPVNDETLTMTGYDWWRYRAAIEQAERERLHHDVERLPSIQPTGYPEPVHDLISRAAVLRLLEPQP